MEFPQNLLLFSGTKLAKIREANKKISKSYLLRMVKQVAVQVVRVVRLRHRLAEEYLLAERLQFRDLLQESVLGLGIPHARDLEVVFDDFFHMILGFLSLGSDLLALLVDVEGRVFCVAVSGLSLSYVRYEPARYLLVCDHQPPFYEVEFRVQVELVAGRLVDEQVRGDPELDPEVQAASGDAVGVQRVAQVEPPARPGAGAHSQPEVVGLGPDFQLLAYLGTKSGDRQETLRHITFDLI